MAASITLLESASRRGYLVRESGDLVVVTLPGAAFVTTAQDHVQAQQWARIRPSLGRAQRDLAAYCDRHHTLLARDGCGLTTRGRSEVLTRLVKDMRDCGMTLAEWAIPDEVNQSIDALKSTMSAPGGMESER